MGVTRFVAKVILLDDQNNFLLLQRSQSHPALANLQDLPGGKVEDDEEPGQAVVRELKEETGLELASLRVVYAVTKFLAERSYPTLLYAGRIKGVAPNVALSYEHQSYEWAPLSRLAEVEPQFAPTYREALEYLRQYNIFESEVID